MAFAALVVLGYLLGSCPWGYWLVRIFSGEDIRKRRQREHRRARTSGAPTAASSAIPVVLLDVLKGFVPGAARHALRVAASAGSSPAPRRCSATGGRSSCASRRAGRWSRPAAASSSASRLCVAVGGRRRLARRVPALRATRRSRRSSRGIALPVFAYLLGYPTSVVLFGVAAAAAILFLHRANLRAAARRAPRTASTSAAPSRS